MDNEKTYKLCIKIESDEIVISGIAGRFPDSDNLKQLQENLFNKVDLVDADLRRWKIDHPDVPRRRGTINNVEKFDADFFNMSFKETHTLEPSTRMLLEHTYEAIIDAGINPKQLRGKNTAVIIGSSYLESQETFLYQNLQIGGQGIVGCNKSTMANMLSYWLDLKGPSYTIDAACSASLHAMALAYNYILSGQCDDAIVGTAHLSLHPFVTLQFSRLGSLSSDGYCRPFDAAANGYTRSEAVTVMYLQRAKDAKRIYAICKHFKMNNDGYKEEGITFPSMHLQSTLLTEFYNECGISPSCLDYLEAHGTGTRVGDPQEVNAIYNTLCKKRKTPLMIGSVKSNLGHTECASALTQIAKVIIAMETGFVPPNMNYTSPRDDIEALVNGTVRVVTEAAPLKTGYIGINSFGFGGSNVHTLLKWNTKRKVNNRVPNDDLPRLVVLSGRTEESVRLFINDVADHPIDVEYIRLLHDIHADNVDGHPWRGYTILDTSQKNPIKEIRNHKTAKRPVWFIFSALDSQWPGMGQDLLKFHTFANAIKKCDAILKPYGTSVTDILTKVDENVCVNALYTFLGVVAVQIGLVDLLTSLGIIPDNIIGYSAGELGCAYADECLTIEQTILSAYFSGLAFVEGNIIRGSMAIVDLDYERLQNLCPMDIDIACHNSQNSTVISGPTSSVHEVIKRVQINNVHVKEISCCNIPYHSRHIASVESELLFNLKQIIPQPKERSSRWLSTSVPRAEWPSAKFSSANYHTRSILNTVLFEQTARVIPNNAVIIEIAPDGVLQRILNESLHPEVTNVILTERSEQNAIEAILRGIGRLYNCGLQPQIANLYPPVEFPVSRGTPMISPSIRWNHSEDWFVTTYQAQKHLKSRERFVEIKLNHEDYAFMAGHVIDGRNLLPATGYLTLVWETIGMLKGETFSTIPVVFRDVNFIRATHLRIDDTVELTIAIQTGSGKFEVTEGNSAVVTGVVYATSNPEDEMMPANLLSKNDNEEEHMTSRDIYKELKLRGYQYSGGFCGLKSVSVSGDKGDVAWTGNWVTFMDSMLQMYILGTDTRDLHVSTNIQKLVIDPARHMRKLQDVMTEKNKQLSIRVYKNINVIISGGIEIRGAKTTSISRKSIGNPVIEEHRFIAHQDCAQISLDNAIRISTQLALEDHQIIKVKTIELVEDTDNVTLEDLSSPLLVAALDDTPLIQANVTLITSPNRFDAADLSQKISIVDLSKSCAKDKAVIAIGFNLLTKQQNSLERLLQCLREGGYLLTREKCDAIDYEKYLRQHELNIVLEKRTDKETILLLKKKVPIKRTTVVYISNRDFGWLADLKSLMNDENRYDENSRIVIVGERDFDCGLLGFISCLRKEPGGEFIRGFLIQDDAAPKFSLQDPLYTRQLRKDMTINVLRPNETWGSYRHLRLPHPEAKPVPSAYVTQTVRGDLSTFRWMENDMFDAHREDLVRVIYSSINFRDIMLATGKLSLDSIIRNRFQMVYLGTEYVGYDVNGQRVMGLCDNKCMANVVAKDKDLCWNIPDTWTFEEAATIPSAYSTAYYALCIRGKMQKGNKILIHCGAGGVGQAAIHLALKEGCEVFTTVGTAEKRKFLRENFPTIPNERIASSRDTNFEQMIMRQTSGRGVDIVLNSLAEEKLIASVRCVAQNGRFLEIGKFDLISNNHLGTSAIQKGISFHGVMLDAMLGGNHKHKSRLSKWMAGFINGTVKPLPVKVFPKTEIEAAFRHMTSGKHIGKTILKIQEEDKPLDASIVAYRRYYCRSDKSYIILGGLGGFGLELTDWLILRGARNIVLISRNGVKNGHQRMKIKLWKSYGVNVLIVKNINVADPKDCEYLLRNAERQAPVDAIFNLAMVLKENVLKNQSAEMFAESCKPKAWATQTLDRLSRNICSQLRHFVVFSSISCGRGNIGLTSYGMANSVMERVCERRTEEGLHGLAIQWGAMSDAGFVADMQEDDKDLVVGGTLQQRISSCLDELEKFLLQDQPIVSCMIVAEKKGGSSRCINMMETVANIMNIKDTKIISLNTSLPELGMDSMMAVEIKQTLEREFDVFLTAQEIRHLTFAKLVEMSNANVSGVNTQAKMKNSINEPDVTKLLFGVMKNEDFTPEVCLELSLERRTPHTTEVFLIPGIYGNGSIFNCLASSIKLPTTSLQYGTNNIDTTSTISETADYLLKQVLPRLKGGKDFVMLGYSFGSILAIELTAKLEAIDFKGRLVLVDGAPEQIRTIKEHYLPSSDDAELQVHILINILKVYEADIIGEVLVELKKCKTWNERFDTFAEYFLAANTSISRTNLKTMSTTIYKHLTAIPQYNPSTLPSIKSPVTLLKPTLMYPVPEVGEDYGLHKITQNKVEIHYVEGNHITILRNKNVAAAINGEMIKHNRVNTLIKAY